MAKFPVDISDKEGIVDAVNYTLSGPAGLGQNFAGFSNYKPYWLTGNFRVPFTKAFWADEAAGKANTPAALYVPPIALTSSEMLDGRTWKFTFTTKQKTAPFALGNGITVEGVADSFYNDTYSTIGVTQCTTEYVIVRTTGTYTIHGASTGGTVKLITGTGYNSTDANARVTVTGGSDRVFISAQLDNVLSYLVNTTPAALRYTVAINRYKGFLNNDPINPDYLFDLDETVAEKTYIKSGLVGNSSLPIFETVFTTVLDQPAPGFYWYILEVKFEFNTHQVKSGSTTTLEQNGQVTSCLLGLRSLSAQVVKQ